MDYSSHHSSHFVALSPNLKWYQHLVHFGYLCLGRLCFRPRGPRVALRLRDRPLDSPELPICGIFANAPDTFSKCDRMASIRVSVESWLPIGAAKEVRAWLSRSQPLSAAFASDSRSFVSTIVRIYATYLNASQFPHFPKKKGRFLIATS